MRLNTSGRVSEALWTLRVTEKSARSLPWLIDDAGIDRNIERAGDGEIFGRQRGQRIGKGLLDARLACACAAGAASGRRQARASMHEKPPARM